MAALPLYPLAEEREPGTGDVELVAVQLQEAIRSCTEAQNWTNRRRNGAIDAIFRRKVVIWVIETMATAFRAPAEVSHLAVAFIDRFIAATGFGSDKENLEPRMHHLTLACMHLAITFADTPEALATFEHAVGGIEDRKSLCDTQYELLRSLKWRLHITTTFNVFELIRALDVDASALPEDAVYVARILVDLALSEAAFLAFSPAEVAVAAAAVGLRDRGLHFGGVHAMMRHYGVDCPINHDAYNLMVQLLQRATEPGDAGTGAAASEAPTPHRADASDLDMSRSGSVTSRVTVQAVPDPSSPSPGMYSARSLAGPSPAPSVAQPPAMAAQPQPNVVAIAPAAAPAHGHCALGRFALPQQTHPDEDEDEDEDAPAADAASSSAAHGWGHASVAASASMAAASHGTELGLHEQPHVSMRAVGEASAWATSLALGPDHELAGALSARAAGAATPAPLTASAYPSLDGAPSAFGGATLSMASCSGASTLTSASFGASSSSGMASALADAGVGQVALSGFNPVHAPGWQQ